MSPWLLLAVTVGTLYIGGCMLRLIFRCFDQARDRERFAQASPREGAKHTEGMGS